MDTTRPQRELAAEAADGGIAGLLRDVAAGTEGAFTLLYARLWHPVHGVVRQILADRGTAEDVTQQVLLEIWLKAASYDPAKAASAPGPARSPGTAP